MNNMECAIAVLASHRAARQWTDEAVAAEMLAQLGLDPAGVAAHATPPSPDDLDSLVVEAEQRDFEAEAKAADAERIAEIRAMQSAQAVAAKKPVFPNQRGRLANPPSGVREPKS